MSQNKTPDAIKIALPKGKLLETTACFLTEIGLKFDNYKAETRIYRLKSTSDSGISAKIFQEKDIPIQVAVGNYDIGICGLDWIEELMVKYPDSPIIKITDLEYNRENLYLASSKYSHFAKLNKLANSETDWRIVSEYPNLAEATAQTLRLRRFRIFPVWGGTEVYPPENAELILIKEENDNRLKSKSLLPVKTLLQSSAFLIVNKDSWQRKNIGNIITRFSRGLRSQNKPWLKIRIKADRYTNSSYYETDQNTICLALPDGHQLKPTWELIEKCGLNICGYSDDDLKRRPVSNLDWLKIKVIRPQDMPMQIANGNFDLAITGKDWLLDHIYRFPCSPVIKLVDLGFGAVRIVAVVDKDRQIDNLIDLKSVMRKGKLTPLRVASEYINIADRYLHDNHIPGYKIIPTWGATEALLPDDADMLIENTQTGKTLAAHNLKIIDTLLHSTACLVANKESIKNDVKKNNISYLVNTFKKATEGCK